VHGLLTTLMMDAVSTFEMSVNFYQATQCSIPEEEVLIYYFVSEHFTSPLLNFIYSHNYCQLFEA
jgi:hypothetical protein